MEKKSVLNGHTQTAICQLLSRSLNDWFILTPFSNSYLNEWVCIIEKWKLR